MNDMVGHYSDVQADKKVKWFQVYYDIISQINKFDYTVPIFCEFGNKYFENKAIISIYQNGLYRNCDYISIISSKDKFVYKTGYDPETAMRKMASDNCKHRVYCFGNNGNDNVWLAGNKHHCEEFSIVGQAIFQKIGIKKDITKLPTLGIYSNFWIAQKKIFIKYCEDILIPVYLLMEKDGEINKLINREIAYKSNAKRDDVKYTWHTFIMERCFTTFLSLNKIKVMQL